MEPEKSSGGDGGLWKRRQAKAGRQVIPMRIVAFDQIDFPSSVPTLELLLARNRLLHPFELLEADDPLHGVARSEAVRGVRAMLPQPR